MKSFAKSLLGFFFVLFIIISCCLETVSAKQLFITTDTNTDNEKNIMDSKSIDDLLGPDTNFPFDPSNHRDGSNPIKRIGSISEDNL